MGDNTKISWADATWNCIYGCSRVSAGCQNCYAERHCHRFAGIGQRHEGLTKSTQNGPRWTGKVQLAPHRLDVPLRWKRGRRIFWNSLSDPFHPDVPFEYVAAMFGVGAATPQHTHLVLTKRPKRMREFFEWIVGKGSKGYVWQTMFMHARGCGVDERKLSDAMGSPWPWPLPNVHLGVTVENQDAIHRIDDLLACPAASYFLSLEPLLGPVDLGTHGPNAFGEHDCGDPPHWDYPPKIDQVIVGGESGPGARPCDVSNIRSIIEQCREAGVACFNKQMGARRVLSSGDGFCTAHPDINHIRHRSGADPSEWPPDLRVQEFPDV